jgi:Fe-S-cluster containining protein
MVEVQATPDVVQADFTLAVGGGKLHASIAVTTAPTTVTALLPVLRVLSNNIIDAVTRQVNAEGYEISCRAGCGACCRQLVPISFFEADALATWIRSLPPEQQAGIEARFVHALKQLAESDVLSRLDPENLPRAASPEESQLSFDYLAQRVPCPFLDNESCGIHPIRPIVCREYLVTTPPEFCASPTPETVRRVPMPVQLSVALERQGQRLTGQQNGWIPLVFLSAWMRQGTSLEGIPQVPGPELLETIVRELAPQTA